MLHYLKDLCSTVGSIASESDTVYQAYPLEVQKYLDSGQQGSSNGDDSGPETDEWDDSSESESLLEEEIIPIRHSFRIK